jgi:hypothetical protein
VRFNNSACAAAIIRAGTSSKPISSKKSGIAFLILSGLTRPR